ncbi:MAG: response regulator [Bacteroidia bacterium]|nr:response regulator [Bacteroidia bacterium]
MATTIHYLDDDADDLEYFRYALGEIDQKIKLHTHSNPFSFIKDLGNVCKEHPLIFLDINMPGKNGFELLKQIRETLVCNNVPVIMISTSDNPNSILVSRELGANLYVVKPNDVDALKTMIEKLIAMEWKKISIDDSNFVLT